MNEKATQIKDHLIAPLRTAIESGDLAGMRESMDNQAPSSITEAISNRLLVRDFLVAQKQRLSQLDEELEKPSDAGLDERTRAYIQALDNDFKDAFIDGEGTGVTKLKGDERLRRELSEADNAASLAAHLADIDVRDLTSPDEIAEWMQSARDSIVEELWGTVQDYREQGATTEIIGVFHQTIARIVDDINGKISGSLLQ